MSKLQQINAFLNEKLTAVPLEISVLVKKTIAEHQEEISRLKRANARLRRLLDLVFKPEIKLHRLADLQLLTLTEEEVNPEQQHCEQEWSANLGLQESDAEESMWNSINITVENRTKSDGESYSESESTSDYEPPSDSDNSESDHVNMDNRIRLSGLKPLKSKRGRGRPRKETGALPDLKCDVCIKKFATASGLRRHLQNWHSEERPIGLPRKETSELSDLKCNVCGKCLATARSLKRHLQLRHSEERPYMCDTCGQCFALNRYLIRHMKIHADERQHCCTKCGKRFFHKESLKNHMVNIHAGLVFKCDLCGKCLSTKGRLKLHRQNHTGEKSHPCKECDKAFDCESGLIKHMRTHTGEKPFQCKECGKCFGEKGSLTKHMMTHTQEKPHRCNECGRCFNLKGNLTDTYGGGSSMPFVWNLFEVSIKSEETSTNSQNKYSQRLRTRINALCVKLKVEEVSRGQLSDHCSWLRAQSAIWKSVQWSF
ncbi:unnamed protein product [Oncorhynchus mykiss]|uniref:C2H2-type domain-containing protein n=1 Tax=Oncorhynchus mykiss TaxID=8022 RepID=A0A060W3B6_ONCMY|nr:unnamed protein product [Oncorhynchus mykiss]